MRTVGPAKLIGAVARQFLVVAGSLGPEEDGRDFSCAIFAIWRVLLRDVPNLQTQQAVANRREHRCESGRGLGISWVADRVRLAPAGVHVDELGSRVLRHEVAGYCARIRHLCACQEVGQPWWKRAPEQFAQSGKIEVGERALAVNRCCMQLMHSIECDRRPGGTAVATARGFEPGGGWLR